MLSKTLLKRSAEEEEELKNLRSSLELTSRAPAKCPLGGCRQLIFAPDLLVHCLHRHSRDPRILVTKIYDSQPMRIRFQPPGPPLNHPRCMAMLMFGGMEGKPESLPARRHVCFPNMGLMYEKRHFVDHLGIYVMICKSTWYALLPNKDMERDLNRTSVVSQDAGIYVIWLVAATMSKPVYYTLTVFDRNYSCSRSVIRKVRCFASSQNPSVFMPQEGDYLMLRDSEIQQFNVKKRLLGRGVHMELIIHDKPTIDPVEAKKIKYLLNDGRKTDLHRSVNASYNVKMPRTKRSMPRGFQGKLSMTRRPISRVRLMGGRNSGTDTTMEVLAQSTDSCLPSNYSSSCLEN